MSKISDCPLSGPGTVPDERKDHVAALLETNLRTARAWPYKEQMLAFWNQHDAADACNAFFRLWYRSVLRSRLPKVRMVAKTLKAHLGGLLTCFKHRITNSMTECINSKIQVIKADVRYLPFRERPCPYPVFLRQTRPAVGQFLSRYTQQNVNSP
jgi:hypothetical protein